MSSTNVSGFEAGLYRLYGIPVLSIRNFSKFHVMSTGVTGLHEMNSVGSMKGEGCPQEARKYTYTG